MSLRKLSKEVSTKQNSPKNPPTLAERKDKLPPKKVSPTNRVAENNSAEKKSTKNVLRKLSNEVSSPNKESPTKIFKQNSPGKISSSHKTSPINMSLKSDKNGSNSIKKSPVTSTKTSQENISFPKKRSPTNVFRKSDELVSSPTLKSPIKISAQRSPEKSSINGSPTNLSKKSVEHVSTTTKKSPIKISPKISPENIGISSSKNKSPTNVSHKSYENVTSPTKISPKSSREKLSSPNKRSSKNGSHTSPAKITPKMSPEKVSSPKKLSPTTQNTEEISSPRRSPTRVSPKSSPEKMYSPKTRSPTDIFSENKSSQKGSPTRVSQGRGGESVREIMAPKKREQPQDPTNGKRSHSKKGHGSRNRGHGEEEPSNRKKANSRRGRSEEEPAEQMSFHEMTHDNRGRCKKLDIRTSTSDGVVQVGVGVKGRERKRHRRPPLDVPDDVQVRTSASENQVSVDVGLHHRKKKRPASGQGVIGGGDEWRQRGGGKTNRNPQSGKNRANEKNQPKDNRSPYREDNKDDGKQRGSDDKHRAWNSVGGNGAENDERSEARQFEGSTAQKQNGDGDRTPHITTTSKKQTPIKTRIETRNSPPKTVPPSPSPSGFLSFVHKVFNYLTPAAPNKKRCGHCGYPRGRGRRSVQSVRPTSDDVGAKSLELLKREAQVAGMHHEKKECVDMNLQLPVREGERNSVLTQERRGRDQNHKGKQRIKDHSPSLQKEYQNESPSRNNLENTEKKSSPTNRRNSWPNDASDLNVENRQQSRHGSQEYASKSKIAVSENNKYYPKSNRSIDFNKKVEKREFEPEAAYNQPLRKVTRQYRPDNTVYPNAFARSEKSLNNVQNDLSPTHKGTQPNTLPENTSQVVSGKEDRIHVTSRSKEKCISTEHKQHKSKIHRASKEKRRPVSQKNTKKQRIENIKNKEPQEEAQEFNMNDSAQASQFREGKHQKTSRKKTKMKLEKSQEHADEKEESIKRAIPERELSFKSPKEKRKEEKLMSVCTDDEARVLCGRPKRFQGHNQQREGEIEAASNKIGKRMCHKTKVSTSVLNDIRHEAKKLGLVLPPKVDKFLSEMKHSLTSHHLQQDTGVRPSLTCFKKKRSKSAAVIGARGEYAARKESEMKMAQKSCSCSKCKVVAQKHKELETEMAKVANDKLQEQFKDPKLPITKEEQEEIEKKLIAQNASLKVLGNDLLDTMINDSRLLHNLDALCEAIQTGKPYNGIPRKKNEVQSVVTKPAEEESTEVYSSSEQDEFPASSRYEASKKGPTLSTVIECDICSVDMSPYEKKFARYIDDSYVKRSTPFLSKIKTYDPSHVSQIEEKYKITEDSRLQSDMDDSNTEQVMDLPQPMSDQQGLCTEIFKEGEVRGRNRIKNSTHKATQVLTCFVPDPSEIPWGTGNLHEETRHECLKRQRSSTSSEEIVSCVADYGSVASSCGGVLYEEVLVRAKEIYNRIVQNQAMVGLQPDILFSTIVNKLLNVDSMRVKKAQDAQANRKPTADNMTYLESQHCSVLSHRSSSRPPTESSELDRSDICGNSTRQLFCDNEAVEEPEINKDLVKQTFKTESNSSLFRRHKRKVNSKRPKLKHDININALNDKLCNDSLMERRVRTEEVLLSQVEKPTVKGREKKDEKLHHNDDDTLYWCQNSTDKREILSNKRENDLCGLKYINNEHNYPLSKVNKRKWIFDKYQDIPCVKSTYNTSSDFSTNEYDDNGGNIDVNYLTSAAELRKISEHVIIDVAHHHSRTTTPQHEFPFKKCHEGAASFQTELKSPQSVNKKTSKANSSNHSAPLTAENIECFPPRQFSCEMSDEEPNPSIIQLKIPSNNESKRSSFEINSNEVTSITGVKTTKKSRIPIKTYKCNVIKSKTPASIHGRPLGSIKMRLGNSTDNTENSSCNDKPIQTAQTVKGRPTKNNKIKNNKEVLAEKSENSKFMKQHLIANVKSLSPQKVINYLVVDRVLNREESASPKPSEQLPQRSKGLVKSQFIDDSGVKKECIKITKINNKNFLETDFAKVEENSNCLEKPSKNTKLIQSFLEKTCANVKECVANNIAKKKEPDKREVPIHSRDHSPAVTKTSKHIEKFQPFLENTCAQVEEDVQISIAKKEKEQNKWKIPGQSRAHSTNPSSTEPKQTYKDLPNISFKSGERKRPHTAKRKPDTHPVEHERGTDIRRRWADSGRNTPDETHRTRAMQACVKHISQNEENIVVQPDNRFLKKATVSVVEKADNMTSIYTVSADQESSSRRMHHFSALPMPRKMRESRRAMPIHTLPPRCKGNIKNEKHMGSRLKQQEKLRTNFLTPTKRKLFQKTRVDHCNVAAVMSKRASPPERQTIYKAKGELLEKVERERTFVKPECNKSIYCEDQLANPSSENERRFQYTYSTLLCPSVEPLGAEMMHVGHKIEEIPSSHPQFSKSRKSSPQHADELTRTTTMGFKKSMNRPTSRSHHNDNISTSLTRTTVRTEGTSSRQWSNQPSLINGSVTRDLSWKNQRGKLSVRPAFVTVVRAPKGEVVNKAYVNKLPHAKVFASRTKIVPSNTHKVVDARELTKKISQLHKNEIMDERKQDIKMQTKLPGREERVSTYARRTTDSLQRTNNDIAERNQEKCQSHVESLEKTVDAKRIMRDLKDNEFKKHKAEVSKLAKESQCTTLNKASRSRQLTQEQTTRNPIATQMTNCLPKSNKRGCGFNCRLNKKDTECKTRFLDQNQQETSAANYNCEKGEKTERIFFRDEQEYDEFQDDTEEVKRIFEYTDEQSLTNRSRPQSKKIKNKKQDTKEKQGITWDRQSSEVTDHNFVSHVPNKAHNQMMTKRGVDNCSSVRQEIVEQTTQDANYQCGSRHSSPKRFPSPGWAASPRCLPATQTNVAVVSRSQEMVTQQSMEKEKELNKKRMHIKVIIASQSKNNDGEKEIDIKLGYDSEQSSQMRESQVLLPIQQSEQQKYFEGKDALEFPQDLRTMEQEELNNCHDYNNKMKHMGAVPKYKGRAYKHDMEVHNHDPFNKFDLSYGYVPIDDVEDRTTLQNMGQVDNQIESNIFVNDEYFFKFSDRKNREENLHSHEGEKRYECGNPCAPECEFNNSNIDSTAANLDAVCNYTKYNSDTVQLNVLRDFATYGSNSNGLDSIDMSNSEKSINNGQIDSEYSCNSVDRNLTHDILYKHVDYTSTDTSKTALNEDSYKNGESSASQGEYSSGRQSEDCINPNNYLLDRRGEFHLPPTDHHMGSAKTNSPICFRDLYGDFMHEPMVELQKSAQLKYDEDREGVPLITPSSENLLTYAVGSKKYPCPTLKQFYKTMQIPHGPSPSSTEISLRSYKPQDVAEESTSNEPLIHDNNYERPYRCNPNDTCRYRAANSKHSVNESYHKLPLTSAPLPLRAITPNINEHFKDKESITIHSETHESNRTVSKEGTYNNELKQYKECAGIDGKRVDWSDSNESQEDVYNTHITHKQNVIEHVKEMSQVEGRDPGRHFGFLGSIFNMAKPNVSVASECENKILEKNGRNNVKQEGLPDMENTVTIYKPVNYTKEPQRVRGKDIDKYPKSSRIPIFKRSCGGSGGSQQKKHLHCFYDKKYMQAHTCLESDTPVVEVRNSPPAVTCESLTTKTPHRGNQSRADKRELECHSSQKIVRLSSSHTVTVDQLRAFFEQSKEAVRQTEKMVFQAHPKKGKNRKTPRVKSDMNIRQKIHYKNIIKESEVQHDQRNTEELTSGFLDKNISVIKAPSSVNETDSSYSSSCQLFEASNQRDENDKNALSLFHDSKEKQSIIEIENHSNGLILQENILTNPLPDENVVSQIKASPSVEHGQQEKYSGICETDGKVHSSNSPNPSINSIDRKKSADDQSNPMILTANDRETFRREIRQKTGDLHKNVNFNDKSTNNEFVEGSCDPIPQLLKLFTRNLDGSEKDKNIVDNQVMEIVVTVDKMGYKLAVKTPADDGTSSVGSKRGHDLSKLLVRELMENDSKVVSGSTNRALNVTQPNTLQEEHNVEKEKKKHMGVTLATECLERTLGNSVSKDSMDERREVQVDIAPRQDGFTDVRKANYLYDESVGSREAMAMEGRKSVAESNLEGLADFQQITSSNSHGGLETKETTFSLEQQVSTASSSEESRRSMGIRTRSCLDEPWSIVNVSSHENNSDKTPPIHPVTTFSQHDSSLSSVESHKLQLPTRKARQVTSSKICVATQSTDSTTSSSMRSSQVRFDPSKNEALVCKESSSSHPQPSFPTVNKSNKSISLGSSHGTLSSLSFIDSGTQSHSSRSSDSTESETCLQPVLKQSQEKEFQSNSSSRELVSEKGTTLVNVMQSTVSKESPFLGSHLSAPSCTSKLDISRPHQQASSEHSVDRKARLNREDMQSNVVKDIKHNSSGLHMTLIKQKLDTEPSDILVSNKEKVSSTNIQHIASHNSLNLGNQVSKSSFSSKMERGKLPFEAVTLKGGADKLSAKRKGEGNQEPEGRRSSQESVHHSENKSDADDEDARQCKDILSLLYAEDDRVFDDAIEGLGAIREGNPGPEERSSSDRSIKRRRKKRGKTAVKTAVKKAVKTSPPGVPTRVGSSKKKEMKGETSTSHNILSHVGRWFGKKIDNM